MVRYKSVDIYKNVSVGLNKKQYNTILKLAEEKKTSLSKIIRDLLFPVD